MTAQSEVSAIMRHALIIDDNLIVGRAIQARLKAFGFDSFDRTWAEHQTLEAAARHPPDLIVVGDAIAEGSPRELAEKLAQANDAPVLAIAAHRLMLQHRVPEGGTVDGPYNLGELDRVLAVMAANADVRARPDC